MGPPRVLGPPIFPAAGTLSSNRVLKQRGRYRVLRHPEEMPPTPYRPSCYHGATTASGSDLIIKGVAAMQNSGPVARGRTRWNAVLWSLLVVLALSGTACGSLPARPRAKARAVPTKPSVKSFKSATSASTTTVPEQSSPPCSPGQLSFYVVNQGVGTGTRAIEGVFVNSGITSCLISGYPNVQLENTTEQPIRTTETKGYPNGYRQSVPPHITLMPGHRASFSLLMGDGSVLIPPRPTCPVIGALEVVPPTSYESNHSLTASVSSPEMFPVPAIAYPYKNGGSCNTIDVTFVVSMKSTAQKLG